MRIVKIFFLILLIALWTNRIYSQKSTNSSVSKAIGDCEYSLVPSGDVNVNNSTGSFTFQVNTVGTNCTWTVDLFGEDWLTASPSSGTGDATVTINYQQNTGAARTATIRVETLNATIYLNQDVGVGYDPDPDDPDFIKPCPTYKPKESITFLSPIDDQNCLIQNEVIEARDYVKLDDSFTYSAATNAPLTIKADPDIICDADYLSTPIVADSRDVAATGADVGSLPGAASVSPTGAATYNIPIEIPQGTAGMQPYLSITYNSQKGRSLLGKGFNISGLSAITRVAQDLYHDGAVSGLKVLNGTDRFSLDGNRLMLTEGYYGFLNSEYKTEHNNFANIKIISGTFGNYFSVETKDGKTLEYGNSVDSRSLIPGNTTPLSYFLNKVSDKNGNYMTYTYNQEDGELWIKNIDYTGNVGLTPYNTINFYYDERDDVKSYYIAGDEIKQQKILREIVVKTNDKVLKKYNLKYIKDDLNESCLNEIIESNGSGDEYNSTIVKWGDLNSYNITQNQVTVPPYSTILHKDMDFYSMDVNEDGISDLVSTFHYYPGEEARCRYNTYLAQVGSNNNYSFVYSSALSSDFGSYIEKDYLLYTNIGPLYGDLTGSGSNDVIIPKVYTYEDDDPIIVFLIPLKDWHYTIYLPCVPLYSMADFDQDGRDNLIYLEVVETNGYYNGAIMEVIGELGQDMDSIPINLSLNAKPENIFIGDYNNDGLTDLRVVCQDRIYTYKNVNGVIDQTSGDITVNSGICYHYSQQGDFNGDGVLDLILVGDNSDQTAIAYGDGDMGATMTYFPDISGINDNDAIEDNDEDNVIVYDFNNDGLSDFVLFNGIYNSDDEFLRFEVKWYRSTGTDFVLEKTSTSTNHEHAYKKLYVSGDFSGDGRMDLLNYGFDCYNQSSTTTLWRFYKSLNLNFEANKVKAIYDGFNNKTEFKYRPLSHSLGFYTKGISTISDVVNIQAPIYMVESITVPDGIGGISTTGYKYEGLSIHNKGKGLLGFSKITKSNNINNSITENLYEIDSDNYTSLLSATNSFIGSEAISEVVYTNDKKTYYSDKCFFPYTSTVVSNNLLNGTSSTTNNTYDNDGNLTLTTTTDSDGNTESIATTYIVGHNPDVLSLPETVTQTNTIESDTKVTSTFYAYNTNFQIDQKTEFYGTSKPILIDYEYDGFGNTTKATIEADGEQRYTSYAYDSRGLKLIEKNNNKGFKSIYEYDSFNNLIKSFDPNEALTEYKYNSFGRLIQTETPAGQVIDYTLAWDDGNGPSNAVTYTLTESDGVANTKEYSDIFGRVIRKETIGFNGQTIIKDYIYNSKGQLIEETDPHFDGDTHTSKVYTYDTKGRVETITGDYIDVLHEYDYLTSTVTDNLLNTSYIKTYNAKGLLKTATDDDGTISYNYNGYGKADEVITQDGTITMVYDDHGNQTSLVDLNAGTMTYTYTGFGELLTQQDARGNLFTMDYDDLGRIKTKTGSEGTVEYFYDGDKKGLLDKVTHTNGINKEYEYDDLGRLEKSIETIDGQTFTYDYTYDSYGNMSNLTYPNGFAVTKQYDANGYLTQIRNQSTDSLIWEMKSIDALGQIGLTEFGNGIQEDKQYLNQRIESIDASLNFAETYNYNTFGNIEWREQSSGVRETFTYDNLNRLKTSQITGENLLTYEYYSNGNLKNKPGVGTFNYGQNGGGPHALSSVTNNSLVSTDLQSIDFNSINKVERIQENNYDMQFTYGPGGERKMVRTTHNGTNGQTKYYVGLYEKIEYDSGDTQEFNYITSPDGLIAMQTEDNTNGVNFYYVHKDYLGSVRALTNQSGATVEEYAYDAWGNRVNPITWQPDTRTSFIINRGYTGHEHLDMFKLINMNGRVYDPVISRFISPDNYIQAASLSQSYNRYSYCMNNPLMFTDPTGEAWWHWVLGDILTGGAVSTSISATSATAYSTLHVTAVTFQQVMSSLDYASAPFRGGQDNPLGNSFEIDLGMALIPMEPLMDIFGVLPKDESATDSERFLTYVNYFLNGESIQDHFGNGFAHYQNMAGNIDEIGYYQGRTIIRVNDDSFDGYSGVSHGHYVFGENMALNPSDTDYDVGLFAHEFGHTYQSRISGPQYYLNWGVPSGLLDKDYPEDDADYRGHANFGIWYHGYSTSPSRTNAWDYILGPFALFWYY